MENAKEYKVFISYSWTSPEHERWVYNLASRLLENGVDVKLDKWDLKPGQDKFAFMESMVQDDAINRVLIICESGYKGKADNREGGVGTETQIITPEVYNKVSQEKFVPVIAERGDKFDSHVPTYLKSRIAIDMSSEQVYEEGYEKLLRLIAERPLNRKPAKGQLPSFLFEDEKPHFKTNNLVKQLKHMLLNRPEQASYIISDFIDEFKNSLAQFQLGDADLTEPYDEKIYSCINDMLPLRNDYIEFLSSIYKSGINLDVDTITNLFENIYQYTEFQQSGSYNQLQFDHYKFFINELFLYTVVILIENNRFKDLNLLLSTKYFVDVKYKYENGINFTDFRFHIKSLNEYRNFRLKQNRLSITADLLIQRSVFDNKNYTRKLVEADLLLHYISSVKFNGDRYNSWFPTTYIYNEYSGKFNLLNKLVSKRHFAKVKILFDVETKEEMELLIENYKSPYNGYERSFEYIPSIKNYIKSKEVCTYE